MSAGLVKSAMRQQRRRFQAPDQTVTGEPPRDDHGRALDTVAALHHEIEELPASDHRRALEDELRAAQIRLQLVPKAAGIVRRLL